MIAKLKGLIDSIAADYLILDVSGVGYQVYASRRTLGRMGQAGEAVSLLINMQIREDSMTLYGFLDQAEQEWFRLLTSVQGVGAKAALAILSVCPSDKIGFAIAGGDKAALTQADGVGPKLASRILTELKDKAGSMADSLSVSAKSGSGVTVASSAASAVRPASEQDDGLSQDAVSALVNLGYGRTDAYSAVMKVTQTANDNDSEITLQSIIRLALKELNS